MSSFDNINNDTINNMNNQLNNNNNNNELNKDNNELNKDNNDENKDNNDENKDNNDENKDNNELNKDNNDDNKDNNKLNKDNNDENKDNNDENKDNNKLNKDNNDDNKLNKDNNDENKDNNDENKDNNKLNKDNNDDNKLNKDNNDDNKDNNDENKSSNQENFYKYFNSILNKLNIENVMSNDYKMQLCKLFIHRLKKNKECLKMFKNRDYKCFNNILFFSNDNDDKLIKYLKDKDVSNEIWTELQLIILLYEINNNGSKKLIKKLYKKIKVYNKNNNFDNDIKQSKDYVNSNNGFKLPDFGNINLDNMKNLFGEPDKDKTDKTKSLINNIFDDIKNKLDSKDSFNTSDIFSISKELSENYKNKINPSELNLSSVFNSIIDIVKNPEDVTKKFKGVDKKINTNTNEMMKEMQKNLFGDKNPLDLLNNVGGVGLDKVVSTITDNLNLGSNNTSNIDEQTKKKAIEQYYDNVKV